MKNQPPGFLLEAYGLWLAAYIPLNLIRKITSYPLIFTCSATHLSITKIYFPKRLPFTLRIEN
jgi:hypothetical protein